MSRIAAVFFCRPLNGKRNRSQLCGLCAFHEKRAVKYYKDYVIELMNPGT